MISLFPRGATGLPERDHSLTVGDPRVVDFLVAFARRLLKPSIARQYPELASLGFFLRRAPLAATVASVEAAPGELRFGRGLVFHIPPANVDTIFVYSWALSALAGNSNIVRISERSAGAATVVIEALNETLAEADPVIAATQRMVSYGRDDKVTTELSEACDLRVIWGGDNSVNAIRRYPLAPHARDLTFPDRSSFSIVSAAGWAAADDRTRKIGVEGFYNDSYWFDQAACASPRAIFWVGGEPDPKFWTMLDEVIAAKDPQVDAAMAIEKRVNTYGLALDGDATGLHYSGNALATVDLVSAAALPRRWLGVGTFPSASVASLDDLVPLVQRRDQTVTHFGFSAAELETFARALAGRGVDRFVPMGDALNFAPVWDGYALLREFTRLVTIKM